MNLRNREKLAGLLLLALIPVGLVVGSIARSPGYETAGHWAANYLLPIFFFVVGVELRTEFSTGYFKVRRNILAPTVAATLGVLLPALLYIVVVGASNRGWVIPTATDITLGLAVLALAPTGFGTILRARFLALATIDDLLALLILVIVFSQSVQVLTAVLAFVAVTACVALQRIPGRWALLAVPFAGGAVLLCAASGVQTSLVGVALGISLRRFKGIELIGAMSTWLVLPVFTFLISASAGQSLAGGLSAIVLVALLLRPVGKYVGIAIGGSLTAKAVSGRSDFRSWSLIGVLGGIGFTVSLLLARLAFVGDEPSYVAGVIATLGVAFLSALLFLLLGRFRGLRERQAEKSL